MLKSNSKAAGSVLLVGKLVLMQAGTGAMYASTLHPIMLRSQQAQTRQNQERQPPAQRAVTVLPTTALATVRQLFDFEMQQL